MTAEIMYKIEKLSAFFNWLNHHNALEERKYKTRYITLRQALKRLVHERQIEYWNQVVSEVDPAIINTIHLQCGR